MEERFIEIGQAFLVLRTGGILPRNVGHQIIQVLAEPGFGMVPPTPVEYGIALGH